jgi:hypothetical protein
VAIALSGDSGLWTTEDFVLVDEDDYQANHEERDHRPAQEIEVADYVQHWNLHRPKVAGDIHLEKDSGCGASGARKPILECARDCWESPGRLKGKIT